MLNLIAKDIKLLFGRGKGRAKVFRLLFLLLAVVGLIAMETYVYREILSHLTHYAEAPISFTSVFLFVISMLLILSATAQAEKLFYNAAETREMAPYPVSSAKMIFSKMILLFFSQFIISTAFIFPVLISYGALLGRMPFFYFLCFFYPVFGFFFEVGIGLLLAYPYHRLKLFLKNKPLVQFIVAVAAMAVLAYLYGLVLNAFLDIITGEGINAFFTTERMNALNDMRGRFIIANYLVEFFIEGSLSALLRAAIIFLPVFGAGLGLTIPLFSMGQGYGKSTRKESDFSRKLSSPKKALFQKEFALLFRDSDNLFSYSGLLIMQPYFCYLVVLAMNKLLTTGAVAYYLVMFPGVSFYADVFLILFFAALVASGGSDFITREKGATKVLKTMPVPPMTQMWIKASIPIIASSLSLLVTIIVLSASKQINGTIAVVSLIGGLSFLFGFNLLSFIEELRRKVGQNASHFLSGAYTYVVPLAFLALVLPLSVTRMDATAIFYIGLAVVLLLVTPVIITFFVKKKTFWDEMEVSN